jgi:UDP-N-acetylglucosamine 2-epimerase (non-hydrolysing)
VKRSDASDVTRRLSLSKPYALLTLHRPSNVDDEIAFRSILEALAAIGRDLPVVFPAHPRTVARMRSFGVETGNGLRVVDPLGYLDFLHLQKHATLVLTDSGGVQEETSILGVPCLTLRNNTERPITLTRGTNRLVGTDRGRIVSEARRILSRPRRRRAPIPLWDGRAAERIAAVFARVGAVATIRHGA